MHWYFHQLRSGRMGAVVIYYINAPPDAVKYCTNTPKRYKSLKIEYLFTYIFLSMYWEPHVHWSSKMGPYAYYGISVQIPQHGINDRKPNISWHFSNFLCSFCFFTIYWVKRMLVRKNAVNTIRIAMRINWWKKIKEMFGFCNSCHLLVFV